MIDINKNYNEDCLLTMAKMPDEFIDLVITSPPYDNLRDYKKYTFDFENTAKQLFRIIKSGGIITWIVGDATIKGTETGTSFKQVLYFKSIGLNIHDTMIYRKNSLTFPDVNRYYQCFEYMFILSKGKPKTTNLIADKLNKQANKTITSNYRDIDGSIKEMSGKKKKRKIKDKGIRWNIWEYNTGWQHSYTEEYLKGHPAIFPEQLVKDHLISWSKEGDLVYDPFMGAGTVAKCCKLLNRNWIGSEVSEEYCKIIEERIKNI